MPSVSTLKSRIQKEQRHALQGRCNRINYSFRKSQVGLIQSRLLFSSSLAQSLKTSPHTYMALSRKLFQRSSFGTRSMSWWRSVQPAPKDPILGVTEAFLADPTPHKVNVGVVSLSFFSFCVYLGHLCEFSNRRLNLPSFLLSDFLLSIPICSTTYTFPF